LGVSGQLYYSTLVGPGEQPQFPLYSRHFGHVYRQSLIPDSAISGINHFTLDIHSVDQLLHQRSYFSSCKLYVYNCNDVVPVNYCYFSVHVQIELKLTMGGVLSSKTPIHHHGVQKDKSIFMYTYHYNCVSVIGCLHKQLREGLMYLAQFYSNTINTPS
jgi:hypothetical protein